MAMGGSIYPKPLNIHLVTSTESAEFTHLVRTLSLTSIIGLDAEWKPFCLRSGAERYTVPTVSLLQVACQLDPRHSSRYEDSVVFLLDLCSIHLPAILSMLRDVFVSRDVLKLGFQFKQDLVNLSHTFVSQGCEAGFDRVEPYMDISSMYTYLQSSQLDSIPKATKGLAAICDEVLGVSLSKELQCSDWSSRPLTEDQKIYAAADVDCLLEIFSRFRAKVAQEENSHDRPWRNILPMEESLLEIVRDFGEDMTVGKSIKTAKGSGKMVGKPIKTPKTSKKTFKKSIKKAGTSKKEQKIINDEQDLSSPPIQESLAKLVRGFGKLMVDESNKTPENLQSEEKIESSLTITDGQGPQSIEESLARLGRNSRKVMSEHNYVKRPNTSKGKKKLESSEAIGYKQGCPDESPAKSPKNFLVDKSIKTPNISTGKDKVACSMVHDGQDPQLSGKSPLKVVRKRSKKVKLDGSVKTAKQIKRKEIIESVVSDWQGPPPWDSALGGDRCPKFLCDKMFKGLAKYLRYVGIDAASPSKKRVIKELFNQSYKEKRVLLTNDVSLLGSAIVYLVKTTGKDEQLLEVFNTFQLKITKGQLTSRCCDCNGTWIKFLTGEQVVEAADSTQMKTPGKNWGFWKCMDCSQLLWEVQVPPRCFHCSGKFTGPLRAEGAVEAVKDVERPLGKNLVFWQCLGCSQLHWEGNYHMLFQKLIDAGKFYDLA